MHPLRIRHQRLMWDRRALLLLSARQISRITHAHCLRGGNSRNLIQTTYFHVPPISISVPLPSVRVEGYLEPTHVLLSVLESSPRTVRHISTYYLSPLTSPLSVVWAIEMILQMSSNLSTFSLVTFLKGYLREHMNGVWSRTSLKACQVFHGCTTVSSRH